MKHKLKIGICALLAIVAIVSIFTLSKQNVSAIGTSISLKRAIWSDNVGWMSVSSRNCDTNNNGSYDAGDAAPSGCPTSGLAPSFQVLLDEDTGILSGYAWSDSIGWISFNETSGCPTGTCQPKIVSNKMQGWVKAIVADGNGWDGWISLGKQASDSVDYGVTRSVNTFSGYPWGSDVVGWMDFGLTVLEGSTPGGCGSADKVATSTEPSFATRCTGPAWTPEGGSVSVVSNVYTWNCKDAGTSVVACTAPKIVDGRCDTAKDGCQTGNTSPLPDTLGFHNWKCVGINGGTTDSTCLVSQVATTPSCIPVIEDSIRLLPPIVAVSTSTCKIISLTVSNNRNGVTGATTCAPITCSVDGVGSFSVREGIPMNPGVDISVGPHTITCTNRTNSATSNPNPKCLLNSIVGEF